MPTAVGLILIKQFSYRDTPDEEWSNKYWFTGSIPPDEASWKALSDEIIASEKQCYSPGTNVVRAYGYNNSDPGQHAVWTYDYEGRGEQVPGTMGNPGTAHIMAGDQAAVLSWKTTRRNQRGKWIYLRKYFHDGFIDNNDTDAIAVATWTAYNAHGLKMHNGTLANGRVIRSPAQDETIVIAGVDPWVTTRTLKRRGKRPRAAVPSFGS